MMRAVASASTTATSWMAAHIVTTGKPRFPSETCSSGNEMRTVRRRRDALEREDDEGVERGDPDVHPALAGPSLAMQPVPGQDRVHEADEDASDQDVVVHAPDTGVENPHAHEEGGGQDDGETGEREAGSHRGVGDPPLHDPSRARSVNRSATEPSGRTHVASRRSSTTSTWRNCRVRSATAVKELWPTGVVLQPPPLTT